MGSAQAGPWQARKRTALLPVIFASFDCEFQGSPGVAAVRSAPVRAVGWLGKGLVTGR